MIERSSIILSMAPKKAVLNARKRHELSSGIMRRIRVEAWSGKEISGASLFLPSPLCERDSGLLGLGASGGDVPKLANEKDEGAGTFEDSEDSAVFMLKLRFKGCCSAARIGSCSCP